VAIDPIGAFEFVRNQLFTYYDTPFGISDERLQAERRALLDREDVTWKQPWFEPVPRWRSSDELLSDVLRRLGVSSEVFEMLSAGIAEYPKLYTHQQAALEAHRSGRDVLITSGTGSGKTEAMFIPLLTELAL
jgi:ATP-dependent helicase YprA (DUF1998 family)